MPTKKQSNRNGTSVRLTGPAEKAASRLEKEFDDNRTAIINFALIFSYAILHGEQTGLYHFTGTPVKDIVKSISKVKP